MTARAETAAQRLAILEALGARNRIVSILRIGVPALGVLVLVAFFLQIFVASLAEQFGIGRLSFSGDKVVVDTPSFSGVMEDGDLYTLSAEGASTPVTSLNVIDIRNGMLTLKKPDGRVMTARAENSHFDTLRQVLTIPETAVVGDSAGNAGTLQQVEVDVPAQSLAAKGPVHLRLHGGATIDSEGLTYASKTGLWNFGHATVVIPESMIDAEEEESK